MSFQNDVQDCSAGTRNFGLKSLLLKEMPPVIKSDVLHTFFSKDYEVGLVCSVEIWYHMLSYALFN